MSRKPLMAANWKMMKTTPEARAFLQDLASKLSTLSAGDLPDVVVCPPYTALDASADTLSSLNSAIALGAQNMESKEDGAYTGEIAPRMLAEFGVRYVILGHSERRQYYAETDATVNVKIKTALAHNLTPIVCVGELLSEREAGQTDRVVKTQIEGALSALSSAEKQKLVFAYEPVWAIGTGKVCEADEANRVCGAIRQWVGEPSCRILYGGSVKPDNVSGLMAQSDIDGGLVGGASLEATSFFALVQACLPAKV